MKLNNVAFAALIGMGAVTQGAWADEQDLGAAVLIELNAAASTEAGCKLSFFVMNGHEAPIEKAVYETVLFDAEGQVDRLTLFDFGELPAKRPRVRQFTVPGTACEGLSRVLINGAHSCEAAGLDEGACEKGLLLETRTDIEVIG